MSDTKICKKCGSEKVLYQDKRWQNSGAWRCGPCTNARVRERYHQNIESARENSRLRSERYRQTHQAKETRLKYYQENKERYAERERSPERKKYMREYRQRNAERLNDQVREHYQANRENILKQQREYYQQNAEAAKTNAREWAKRNPDRVKERSRAYAKKHPERVRATKRKWAAANPEYSQFKCAERRARKREVVNTLTTAEWKEIQQRFDHRCAYCGRRQKLSMDHVTPLIKGGDHTADNIVPACQSCNSKKQAGPPLAPVQTLLFA